MAALPDPPAFHPAPDAHTADRVIAEVERLADLHGLAMRASAQASAEAMVRRARLEAQAARLLGALPVLLAVDPPEATPLPLSANARPLAPGAPGVPPGLTPTPGTAGMATPLPPTPGPGARAADPVVAWARASFHWSQLLGPSPLVAEDVAMRDLPAASQGVPVATLAVPADPAWPRWRTAIVARLRAVGHRLAGQGAAPIGTAVVRPLNWLRGGQVVATAAGTLAWAPPVARPHWTPLFTRAATVMTPWGRVYAETGSRRRPRREVDREAFLWIHGLIGGGVLLAQGLVLGLALLLGLGLAEWATMRHFRTQGVRHAARRAAWHPVTPEDLDDASLDQVVGALADLAGARLDRLQLLSAPGADPAAPARLAPGLLARDAQTQAVLDRVYGA